MIELPLHSLFPIPLRVLLTSSRVVAVTGIMCLCDVVAVVSPRLFSLIRKGPHVWALMLA